MSAGDFYFAINATFRFIHDLYGRDALVDYWSSMAREPGWRCPWASSWC